MGFKNFSLDANQEERIKVLSMLRENNILIEEYVNNTLDPEYPFLIWDSQAINEAKSPSTVHLKPKEFLRKFGLFYDDKIKTLDLHPINDDELIGPNQLVSGHIIDNQFIGSKIIKTITTEFIPERFWGKPFSEYKKCFKLDSSQLLIINRYFVN